MGIYPKYTLYVLERFLRKKGKQKNSIISSKSDNFFRKNQFNEIEYSYFCELFRKEGTK